MKHQKHNKISRPQLGNFGRVEISFLGTNCTHLKSLFDQIVLKLSPFKIAIVDADHQAESCLISDIEVTDKINHYRIDQQKRPNKFQLQNTLSQCDLVLINGNHESASCQIVIIDEKKPLNKKIDRLSQVALILFKDKDNTLPEYLINSINGIENITQADFANIDFIVDFLKQKIHKQIPPLNGLVLRGGQSQRMGQDKAFINYNGEAQKDYTFNMINSKCEHTFVSINPNQTDHLPAIKDTFIGLGPLSGILSAFMQNPDAAWLVIACDLPYLTEATIDFLIRNRNPSKIATAFISPQYNDEQQAFPEPLITIYEPKAYLVLLQMLSLGVDCPRKTLINYDVEIIQFPDNKEAINVNNQEEYLKAKIDLSPKIA